MAHFSFDEATHVYALMPGSRHVPSVTQVLEHTGMAPDLSFLDAYYRERGRAIHIAMALELMGTLDEATLDERIVPFIERGRRWLDQLDVTPLVVEYPWVHTVLEYGGTLDLFCESKIGLLLIDWKSTLMDPAYQIQVAGGYEPLLIDAAEHGAVGIAPGDVKAARMAVVTLGTEMPKMHWCGRQNSAGILNRDLFRPGSRRVSASVSTFAQADVSNALNVTSNRFAPLYSDSPITAAVWCGYPSMD